MTHLARAISNKRTAIPVLRSNRCRGDVTPVTLTFVEVFAQLLLHILKKIYIKNHENIV